MPAWLAEWLDGAGELWLADWAPVSRPAAIGWAAFFTVTMLVRRRKFVELFAALHQPLAGVGFALAMTTIHRISMTRIRA